jgi:O-antigen/teichoic acid export membrane protein
MSEVENTVAKPERSAVQRIARNTVIGIGAQLGLKLASAVFQVLVVRQLGGAQFGEYSSVLAWAGLFSVLGDMGITQYLAREIARDRSKTEELFWDTVCFRFLLGIITIIITSVGAVIWGYSTQIVIATSIFTISYIFQSILAPLSGVLTGNERLDITSILAVITQVLFYLFAGLFLFLQLDFVWLAVAATISTPIMLILTWWFVRRNNLGPPRFHINPRIWPTILRAGVPFALIQLSLSFSFRVDTVILSKHVSDIEIGWYNVAYNLIFMINSVVFSFSTAVLPTLAKEHANNPESVRPWYYHSTRILLFVGLPAAFAVTVLSDKIIHFLYQPQIGPAAIPLMILIWDLPFVMYHSFCGNLTQSMKLEGKAARVYGSLGIANVIFNLILIPPFGIIGSSFSTVLTDAFGAIQYYFLLRHTLGSGLRFTSIIRIAGAAVVMSVLLYLLLDLNLILIIAVGGITYLLLVWFSGAFSSDERGQLVGFVRRRLHV